MGVARAEFASAPIPCAGGAVIGVAPCAEQTWRLVRSLRPPHTLWSSSVMAAAVGVTASGAGMSWRDVLTAWILGAPSAYMTKRASKALRCACQIESSRVCARGASGRHRAAHGAEPPSLTWLWHSSATWARVSGWAQARAAHRRLRGGGRITEVASTAKVRVVLVHATSFVTISDWQHRQDGALKMGL